MAYGMPWLLLEVKSSLVHSEFQSIFHVVHSLSGASRNSWDIPKNRYVWTYENRDFLIHAYFLTAIPQAPFTIEITQMNSVFRYISERFS